MPEKKKDSVPEKELPYDKGLGEFIFLLSLVVALVPAFSPFVGGGLGQLNYTSLIVSLVPILYGVYLGALSVRGEISASLWSIFFSILPMVIFVFTARDIISFFERVF
ncbi:MAG: hypothetical protein Q4D19_10630 [Lautropia sp.]|nr:hypothetical protein [Lautropia sp.]